MPEEVAIVLVIVLAIIIGVIWLLVKILEGIGDWIDQISKNYEAASARRKQNRYTKVRDRLRPYVRTVIPNELDSFEKKLERTRTDFTERVQKLTNLVAYPPTWTKEEFKALGSPHKDTRYREMCIDEIDAILTPNPDSSTWAYEELEITGRQCKYPFGPPTSKPGKFTVFPTISADLKEAVFEVDESHVSKKDVDRYFADDTSNVSTYNKRRADLIAKTSNLNSAIEDWNKKARIAWV